jgi:hypothetical protein
VIPSFLILKHDYLNITLFFSHLYWGSDHPEIMMESTNVTPEFVPITIPRVQLSINGHKAVKIITATYESSWVTLHASDSDPYRLRIHNNRLLSRVMPILQALENEVQGDMEWLLITAGKIAELIVDLEGLAATADERYACTLS